MTTPQRTLRWQRPSPKILAFVAICVLALGVATAQTLASASRVRDDESTAKRGGAAPLESLLALSKQPHMVFLQSTGDTYRRVALATFEPEADPLPTDLWCQRVYFAGGRGLCLGEDAYKGGAFIFDANYQVTNRFPAAGLASRARVSNDGQYGSFTVFVQGHSYAEAGFSTRTAIVDMATGKFVLEDLEKLDVRRNGARMDAVDRNFWGVTFVPGGTTFYATVGTGGQTYLIYGDFMQRTAVVLRENVECPSVSPDGKRIAFKKRVSSGLSGVKWELRVLELATMTESALGEQRNVDDQVEWLDNEHVMYSLPDEGPPATIRPDLWVAALDGSPARQLQTGAFSPAIVD